MEGLVLWYQTVLGNWMPKEMFVFFVSMLPLIELRGGLIIASLLNIPLVEANIICIIGNIIPIPFILNFIKKIFNFLKKFKLTKPVIEKIEKRALRKSGGVENSEFLFLLLFVGIPIPGTGAWTGSLISALLEIKHKKAIISIILGLFMALAIMDVISYGLIGLLIH